MNLSERLRRFGFNPQFLRRPGKEIQPLEAVSDDKKPEIEPREQQAVRSDQELPPITGEFFDPKLRLSFLSDETAVNLLNRRTEEEEDTETGERNYGQFRVFQPENEENIVPGLYFQTTFAADEWSDSMLVKHSCGVIIDSALERNGIIEKGEPIIVTPAYISPEGKLLLQIKVEDKGQKRSIQALS